MNSVIRTTWLTGLLVLGASWTLHAAGTLDTTNRIEVNRFGDGVMTVEFKLSASEWGAWKQNFGDRPDLVRRNLRQRFACYELGEFKLEKNDMERTAVATIAMRGAIKLRRDGSREIEVPKTMRKVSNTEREWIFSSASHANPYEPVMTETTHIKLPDEAVNVRFIESGSSGRGIVYDIPYAAGGGKGMLFGGIGALAIGLVLGVVGFLPGRKVAPAAA